MFFIFYDMEVIVNKTELCRGCLVILKQHIDNRLFINFPFTSSLHFLSGWAWLCSWAVHQPAVLRGRQAQVLAPAHAQTNHQENQQDHLAGQGDESSKKLQEANKYQAACSTTSYRTTHPNCLNILWIILKHSTFDIKHLKVVPWTDYPYASKANREVANLTERKNPHTHGFLMWTVLVDCLFLSC